MPYIIMLSEEILNRYISDDRIGDEKRLPFRDFFRDKLEKFAVLPPDERAMEINRWCASHVTYKASDDYTKSPIAVYNTGNGRCGEESVFTAAALRTAGIPARQVYVPYWTHCDDNHAWVEYYTGHEWKFFGACEPEPRSCIGWFSQAASRAPLVRTRTWFEDPNEELISVNADGSFFYNVTARYAPCSSIRVQVAEPDGRPAENVSVSFLVVNMQKLKPAAVMKTDSDGCVRLTAGFSTFVIRAEQDTLHAVYLLKADPEYRKNTIFLKLSSEEQQLPSVIRFETADPLPAPSYTADERAWKQAVLKEAALSRASKREAINKKIRLNHCAVLTPILEKAGENAEEIIRFYEKTSDDEKKSALTLLSMLHEKDLADETAERLTAYLHNELPLPARNGKAEEYEAVSALRLPNGSQIVYLNEMLNREIQISPDDMLASYELDPGIFSAFPEIDEADLTLLLVINGESEPEIHLKNELEANKECLKSLEEKGLSVRYISRTEENAAALDRIARNMFTEPEIFPLILLTRDHIGLYANAGYKVGSVCFVTDLIRMLQAETGRAFNNNNNNNNNNNG